MDVLKTRVQNGAALGAAGGMGATLSKLVRTEGVGSLMNGAGMRVVWISPQGCVYYPVYEAAQRFLAQRADRGEGES